MRKLFVVILLPLLLTPIVEARAAMGLKCSQWLEARAYMRVDPRTGLMVDDRPPTARPLPRDLDTMAAHAYWYLAGRVATLMWLDGALSQIAGKGGVPAEKATPADIMTGLMQVDTLCRDSLQKEHRDNDVADVIDLQQLDAVTRRIRTVGGIIHKLGEVGREKGAR